MNKEFVPYEQSLELKELGFDEPCFSIYKTNKERIFTEFYEFDKLRNYSKRSKIGNDWLSLKCYAPLYYQTFRFFREKYKLTGLIEIGTQEYSYNIFNEKGNTILGTDRFNYNGTYEEAELECLKKLIEIVKEDK